jgi:protein phosphatase-4 regulatory subunit 3
LTSNLAALKFFRTSIGLQDSFFNDQVTKNFLFEPILNIVYETMPRDNLLNSACLELFEFIKRENLRPIITHVVENYRSRLEQITYVPVFQELILRYDQMLDYNPEIESALFGQEGNSTPTRTRTNGVSNRWQGVREMAPEEEEYFNTSDDEDELAAKPKTTTPSTNGVPITPKPLVDYPDDDDDESGEIGVESGEIPVAFDGKNTPPASVSTSPQTASTPSSSNLSSTPIQQQSPPERLSEKRRRDEEDEDELVKLSLSKRRTSNSSVSSVKGTDSHPGAFLRRKKSFTSGKDGHGGRRIAISLALKNPIETEPGGDNGG